VTTVMAEAICC